MTNRRIDAFYSKKKRVIERKRRKREGRKEGMKTRKWRESIQSRFGIALNGISISR